MSTRRALTALALVALLGGANAWAASFSIAGGTAYLTPQDDHNQQFPWWGNQVIPQTPGFLGAQLAFQGTANVLYDITFRFLGSEAEWRDLLRAGGSELDNRAAPGELLSVRLRATGGLDLVPFSLVNGNVPSQSVVNGSNGMPNIGGATGEPNFFLGVPGAGSERVGPAVLLALDDHGAGPDVDHDDWVGLVRAERVPEPAALALLAAGLLGVARKPRR